MTENLEEGSVKENRTPYLVFSQSIDDRFCARVDDVSDALLLEWASNSTVFLRAGTRWS